MPLTHRNVHSGTRRAWTKPSPRRCPFCPGPRPILWAPAVPESSALKLASDAPTRCSRAHTLLSGTDSGKAPCCGSYPGTCTDFLSPSPCNADSEMPDRHTLQAACRPHSAAIMGAPMSLSLCRRESLSCTSWPPTGSVPAGLVVVGHGTPSCLPASRPQCSTSKRAPRLCTGNPSTSSEPGNAGQR